MKLIDDLINAFKGATDPLRKKLNPTYVEQLTDLERDLLSAYKFHQKNGAEIFAVFRDVTRTKLTVMGLTPDKNETVKQCLARNSEGASCDERIIVARIEKHRPAEEAFKALWWRPGFFETAEDFTKFPQARKIQFAELQPKLYEKPRLHLVSSRKEPTIQ